jgi:hypothetical protein
VEHCHELNIRFIPSLSGYRSDDGMKQKVELQTFLKVLDGRRSPTIHQQDLLVGQHENAQN